MRNKGTVLELVLTGTTPVRAALSERPLLRVRVFRSEGMEAEKKEDCSRMYNRFGVPNGKELAQKQHPSQRTISQGGSPKSASVSQRSQGWREQETGQ